MENTNYEAMETEYVELVEVDNDVNYDETDSDKGPGIVPVLVGGLAVVAAIGVGVKTVGPKIVKWCEDKTLARAEKIEAKRALKATEEQEVIIEEDDVDVIDDVETEE